jgi:hypothetical protein
MAAMVLGPVRLPAPVMVGFAACLAAACGAGAPTPTISAVSPGRAYSDRPVRLTIQGQGFLPVFQIDPAAGERRGEVSGFSGRVGSGGVFVGLRGFDWLDMNVLTAWMDPGLPAGERTLMQIIDPRGQTASLENGFWSLGPDDDPPTITFEKPGPQTPIAGGVTVDVAIAVADPEPGVLQSVRWDAASRLGPIGTGDCRLEAGNARARCDFQLPLPAALEPGDELVLRAIATDASAAMNRTETVLRLPIQRPPTVTEVSPIRGGTLGGTDVVVRGSGFFLGTEVYLGDLLLLPGGGTVIDQTTIVGRAPAHAPGTAALLVRTPIGEVKVPDVFSYVTPPRIDTIMPELGNPDGGTAIRVRGTGFTKTTQIYFGDSLVGARPCEEQRYISEAEIAGSAPAGRGHTSVWAFEPETGWSRLADGFSWSTSP